MLEYKEKDFLNQNRADLQKQYWKLIKIISGFANNNGGLLILGISEDSNSCADGITPLYQNLTDLLNKLRGLTVSHTIPTVSINFQDIFTNPNNLGDYILIIKIFESPEPVMYTNSQDTDNNKYFFRYNEDTVPADHATLRLLFSKKNIEEKLIEYLESRNFGLKYKGSENVVSWISIPFQLELETFNEINNQTISELRSLFGNQTANSRFNGIYSNGRFSHKGILFYFIPTSHEDSLYNGYFEVKNNGYIEFKAKIKTEGNLLLETYIINSFDEFLEFLYNFYFKYNYYGDFYLLVSLKKDNEDLKLGIRDFTGGIIHATRNNFALENLIIIKRILTIKDLETEVLRSQVFEDIKRELYSCFGIEL